MKGYPREREQVLAQYLRIGAYTGSVLTVAGVIMLTPLLGIPFFPDELTMAPAFIIPALVAILSGIGLWLVARPVDKTGIALEEGGVIVVVSWLMVVVISAVPIMLILNLNFTPALFEAVSGWTTTGLSIIDYDHCPKLIYLWRSIMQYCGGAGLAIVVLSSIIGPPGVGLSAAEGKGDLLVPQVRRSIRIVLAIYSGYSIVGVAAYRWAGMAWFDAINHTFATVSTGGFSTRPASLGYWDSPAIEAVSIGLMLVSSISYVTAWLVLKGRFRFVGRNGEVRYTAVILPAAVTLVFLATCRGLYPTLTKALRVSVFEAVSALTTTGFSTVSYSDWNPFGFLILTLLMVVGGGTCSTAGGLKQFRVYLLWKLILWELRRMLLPQTVVIVRPFWEADRKGYLGDRQLIQIAAFALLYLVFLGLGVGILSAYGYSIQDSLFEFASALGTVGLSIGITAPTAPPGVLWSLMAAMVFGRLEIMVVIVSFLKIVQDAGKLLH